MNRDRRRDGLDGPLGRPRIVTEVGLVEDEDGSGPAVGSGRQVAFDPPEIELVV